MNVDDERRFLNVTAKRNMGSGRYQITFSANDTLFLHPAGWARPIASAQNLQLRPAETSFQKITPVMYYRDATNRLIRSTSLTTGGDPTGEVVADNVTAWTVWLFFEDGDSAAWPTHPMPTTPMTIDDLSSVKVMATLQNARRRPEHRHRGHPELRVAVFAEEPGVREKPVTELREEGTGNRTGGRLAEAALRFFGGLLTSAINVISYPYHPSWSPRWSVNAPFVPPMVLSPSIVLLAVAGHRRIYRFFAAVQARRAAAGHPLGRWSSWRRSSACPGSSW